MNSPKWVPQLLAWYDVNKRDLPWRDCGDPYKVWVSEVMSQQTRIEAMKPYYDNWMRLFPTLEDLAKATEDEVVHAWQGLGYYSRARNLRLGVQDVVHNYGGVVPHNRKDMESLKGVGSYTAGAVLSMAYGEPEVAVDGNVLRIYARLYGIFDDILGTKGKKAITAIVEDTLPHDRPGDFNQALMDFGSAVCIPKTPRCGECPIVNTCHAYQHNVTDQLPVRIKKTKVVDVPVFVGILSYGDYYLLHKRPNRGLLRSMWEFPSVENADSYDAAESGRGIGLWFILATSYCERINSCIFSSQMVYEGLSRRFAVYWIPYINRNDTNAITEGLDAHQTGGIRRLCLGGTSW